MESYLLHKPLAERRRDPLSGMDAAVHEDGWLGGARLLAKLFIEGFGDIGGLG